ncbi:TPA: hypothetical protein JG832_002459 [Enterobacter hormaechei subsp. xiangfangensis]|nr:hypothetical protein [Enterobacter hormaechei subsp. xiangfangensis]HAV1890595.1 hypothetical protein [Enterobacter hormaechei subsp. xiangfangensis]
MASGRNYQARGDGKKADELRPCVAVERGEWFHSTNHVNAPSIPALIRLGYVEFVRDHPSATLWYPVRLTEKGIEAAKTLKVEGE